MLNAEAAVSNSSLRSENTVRGHPELRDDVWTGASLRASLSEIEAEVPSDERMTRRSQSVDLPRPVTPGREHKVMFSKDRDISVSVLSDSAKSIRRKKWVSPLRLLERVKTRRSWGSPGVASGSGGSPQRKDVGV